MSSEGDLHNFGRSVHQVRRASGVYFQKPRPIFWEWFFFGKDSPLAPYFTDLNSTCGQIRDNIFNLEIEMFKNDEGASRQISPTSNEIVLPSHPYSLGVLLGYCYVFGIRDLHRHNVVCTDSHLQVVDAEVVLVKLLLPHETLLLPFKHIGPDLCAGGHVGNLLDGFSIEVVKGIMMGYLDVFSCFQRNLDLIQTVFRERREEMCRVPIRNIVRDTPDYRQWTSKSPEMPFFESELAQLSRGDIPYFFKFIGDKSLYAYTDVDGTYKSVDFPKEFERAILRDATEPEILLDQRRISGTLLPTGLLFLAKSLLPFDFRGTLDLKDHGSVSISEKQISAKLGEIQFESKR